LKSKTVLACSITILSLVYILSAQSFVEVKGCYGPHITAQISSNEVKVNESVTINGEQFKDDFATEDEITFVGEEHPLKQGLKQE